MNPVERRRAWARRFIAQAPESPRYGTAEWLALPEGPAKWASAIRAAECYATEGDDLAERLRLEVEVGREALKAAEDADYVARRDDWRADWSQRSYKPHPTNRPAQPIVCVLCGTPVSPWTCSCGQTRVGEVA